VLVSTVAAAEGVASTAVEVSTGVASTAVEVSTVADIVLGMAAVATAGVTATVDVTATTAVVTATVDVTATTAVVTGTVASCVVEYMAMAVDMAIPVLQDTIILMASVYRTN
jgi:hypothetical protein